MGHELSKILIFNEVVQLIAQKNHISLAEARDIFYNSKTVLCFDDDSLGLYGESPLHIYSLFQEEIELKR